MVVESQMRWRFSNDLLHFRASCFSLQDAVLTAVILFSLCGNSYKGEIFQEEYIHQKCFLYKKRILEISCRYNMLWGESEVAQSCPTLCDPMECSLSGSSVHGIFQARVLEWGAISFSGGSSQPRNWTRVPRIAGRRFTIWAIREALNHTLFGVSLSYTHWNSKLQHFELAITTHPLVWLADLAKRNIGCLVNLNFR